MTTIPATTFSQRLFERSSVRRTWVLNPALTFVAALYLVVAIVELSIVVLAAPSIADLGAFYVPVP